MARRSDPGIAHPRLDTDSVSAPWLHPGTGRTTVVERTCEFPIKNWRSAWSTFRKEHSRIVTMTNRREEGATMVVTYITGGPNLKPERKSIFGRILAALIG